MKNFAAGAKDGGAFLIVAVGIAVVLLGVLSAIGVNVAEAYVGIGIGTIAIVLAAAAVFVWKRLRPGAANGGKANGGKGEARGGRA